MQNSECWAPLTQEPRAPGSCLPGCVWEAGLEWGGRPPTALLHGTGTPRAAELLHHTPPAFVFIYKNNSPSFMVTNFRNNLAHTSSKWKKTGDHSPTVRRPLRYTIHSLGHVLPGQRRYQVRAGTLTLRVSKPKGNKQMCAGALPSLRHSRIGPETQPRAPDTRNNAATEVHR